MQHWIDWLGEDDPDWSRITPHQVRAYAAARHRGGLSPKSLQRRLAALRSLFRYLLREQQVANNPADGIRAPKVRRKLPATLDADQLDRLLDLPGDDPLTLRDKAIMELLYSSGLRLAELVVNGLATDSREVRSGDLFLACQGLREHALAHEYLGDVAFDRGEWSLPDSPPENDLP